LKQEVIEDGSDRRGIQSVEIGLRVIESLRRAEGPLTLKDLAALAELPASNCHRYCASFVRCGFLIQDIRTGRYDLGPRLLQAGLAALSRVDSVAVATETLERLVDETGHTGLLAIWGDAGPTIIRWMQGRMAVRTSLSAGSTLPVLTSATGRIFLAYLPARQTAALAEGEAAGTIDHLDVAAKVRAAGITQVYGEHIPGLSAVAAPILDHHGEAVAVLTLVGATQGIAADAIDRLRALADCASARLGGSVPGTSNSTRHSRTRRNNA
jgi:DNA-binding IclR family transcriptional regulator